MREIWQPGYGENSVEERGWVQEGGCCGGDERMGVGQSVVLNSGDMRGPQSQQKSLVPWMGGAKHRLYQSRR